MHTLTVFADLRAEPRFDAPPLKELVPGERVTEESRDDGWSKVRVHDAQQAQGFVRSEFLKADDVVGGGAGNVGQDIIFGSSDVPQFDCRLAIVQGYLGKQGFAHNLACDGKFGTQTVRAVQGFQEHSQLPVTGRIDRVTGEKMGLPYWTRSQQRELSAPFRDTQKFAQGTLFTFEALEPGGFYSWWPDTDRDDKNPLTYRALRTNNPGAINWSKWQRDKIDGYLGKTRGDGSTSDNETTVYRAPEFGVAAWHLWQHRRFSVDADGRKKLSELIEGPNGYSGGEVPPQQYYDGYAKYSNGQLTRDTIIEFGNAQQMKVLANAAFSHEFGFWYPLTEAQFERGCRIGQDLAASERRPGLLRRMMNFVLGRDRGA